MKINVTISGAQQTRDSLAALAGRMRDLKPAYLRAGAVVLTDAQGRIDAQGPGWTPAAMDYGAGTLLHRTGALYRSLTEGAEGNIEENLPNGIRVGTGLQTKSGLNIGRLQQFGTGIFGTRTRAQPIKPTSKKALVFTGDGKSIIRRSVKGIPQRWFLYINQQTAQKAASVFMQRVRGEI